MLFAYQPGQPGLALSLCTTCPTKGRQGGGGGGEEGGGRLPVRNGEDTGLGMGLQKQNPAEIF